MDIYTCMFMYVVHNIHVFIHTYSCITNFTGYLKYKLYFKYKYLKCVLDYIYIVKNEIITIKLYIDVVLLLVSID